MRVGVSEPRVSSVLLGKLRIGVASCLLAACGASVPKPPLGRHPPTAYVEIPYPPPAAVAEIVPPRPTGNAAWVDGQWTWRGRYFVWERGGWVVPPKGAYFAPWTRYYGNDGTLYFAEAAWRLPSGQRIPPPPVLRPAATPPEAETPEVMAKP